MREQERAVTASEPPAELAPSAALHDNGYHLTNYRNNLKRLVDTVTVRHTVVLYSTRTLVASLWPYLSLNKLFGLVLIDDSRYRFWT